jgi:SNF2 family DNA or RNA helicase
MDISNEIRLLTNMLYLETGRAKVPVVFKHIRTLLKEGNKIVVFAHHQGVLDTLQELMEDKGIKLIRIDGKTDSKKRQTYVEQFQNDKETVIALIGITAAGKMYFYLLPFQKMMSYLYLKSMFPCCLHLRIWNYVK